MEDPWQFLILDRNTATERDVKAAYARLLKLHRPDQDPAGFRKLRAAYESALASLERHNAGSASPRVQSFSGDHDLESSDADLPRVEPPLPFCWVSMPDEMHDALSNLKHAVAGRDTEQIQAAGKYLLTVFRHVRLPPAHLIEALHKAFAADTQLIARGITAETLAYLAEHGHVEFCDGVITFWEQPGDRYRFWHLGDALLKRRELLATPEGAALMTRVANGVALDFPGLAISLVNAAYPHLPVESREQMVDPIEYGVALGKLFGCVDGEARDFWFRLLRNDAAPVAWSSPEARRSVDTLIEVCRSTWSGWSVVKQLMSAEDWAAVEARLLGQAKKAKNPFSDRETRLGWMMGIAAVVVITLLKIAGEHYGSNYDPFRSDSNLERDLGKDWQQTKEARDQLMKHLLERPPSKAKDPPSGQTFEPPASAPKSEAMLDAIKAENEKGKAHGLPPVQDAIDGPAAPVVPEPPPQIAPVGDEPKHSSR